MDRCPICRGKIREDATCRRCGADLQHVIAAEAVAYDLLQQGIHALARGHPQVGAALLARSCHYGETPLARAVQAFIAERYPEWDSALPDR